MKYVAVVLSTDWDAEYIKEWYDKVMGVYGPYDDEQLAKNEAEVIVSNSGLKYVIAPLQSTRNSVF